MTALVTIALILIMALVIIAAGIMGWQEGKSEANFLRKPEADHGEDSQRDG